MKYIGGIIISAVVIGVIVLWVSGGKPEPLPPEPLAASTTSIETTPPDTTQTPPLPTNKITKNGMTIETTQQGTGEAIVNGQFAVMDYTGKLTDGTVFDSNVDPKFGHVEPFQFPLGAGRVIKGWDQGVLGMKVGESRILTIPADLAYGPDGIPGAIPPNATLVFDVTLRAIK